MRDCHSLRIYLRVVVGFFVERLRTNTFSFYLGKLLKEAKGVKCWFWHGCGGGFPPPNQSLS